MHTDIDRVQSRQMDPDGHRNKACDPGATCRCSAGVNCTAR
jgi:hypothetical protein